MSLLAPEKLNIAELPSVLLTESDLLPAIPSLYFVVDSESQVLYIGLTNCLLVRWKQHNKAHEFIDMPAVRICWFEIKDSEQLAFAEAQCILYFQPPFNKRGKLPPNRDLVQTAVRIAPEILRLAKYHLDKEGSNLQEFLSEKLERYVEQRTREATAKAGAGVSA